MQRFPGHKKYIPFLMSFKQIEIHILSIIVMVKYLKNLSLIFKFSSNNL